MKKLAIPLVATVVTVGAMTYQAQTPEVVLADPPTARLGEIPNYTSQPVAAGEAELHTLPSDTIIDKRVYTHNDGSTYLVSLIIGGRFKSSIHRPELCLPAHGFLMQNPRELEVGDIDWHALTLASDGSREAQGFAYTFFNQEGYKTSSHIRRIFKDVWDRSVLNRIDRWAMLTVNSSTDDDLALADFLGKLRGVIR